MTYIDLWKYCPATNEWTWVDNDATTNPTGNWGTLGITAPTNIPNGRSGNILWSDNGGHLYSFGGTTTNYNTPFQDMWKYNIDQACAPCSNIPIALFNAPNHICPGTCTNFNNLSVNATSFLWIFQGATPGTSTDVNPQNICYNTPGNYDVTLIANNPNGSDTLNLINFINVYPYPSPQGISQSGDTLFANPGAVTYQWYYNGSLIPGATDYFYAAPISGDYNVVATDLNNCEVEAAIFDVIAGIEAEVGSGSQQLLIIPNPARDKFTIYPESFGTQFTIGAANEITVYNVIGEKMFVDVDWVLQTVDCRLLHAGMYWLEINSGKEMIRAKFIKE